MKPNPPKINALLEEQKAFLNSVLENTPVAVTGDDAVAALELSELILNRIAEETT